MIPPQSPSPADWRTGYRNAFERVPRPPRTPSPIARDIIFGYQGTQAAMRIIGIIFLAIGVPIAAVLGGGLVTDLTLAVAGQPAMATVTGTSIVSSVEVNGVSPLEIKYSFNISGASYTGESYTTKAAIATNAVLGGSIPIEVLPLDPSWSRVRGASRATMGYGTFFVYLFAFVGAILLFFAVRSNRREIRAYRNGIATKGLVVKRAEDTSTQVNGKHPFVVAWEFQVDGTTYKGSLSNMNREILQRALPDDEVTVLYDPRNPVVNTVWIEG